MTSLERLDVPDDPTDRQLEVLELVAEGKTNPEIAEELVVSCNTVKKHLAALCDRLQAKNRTHLVYEAIRQGHLPCPQCGQEVGESEGISAGDRV